MHFFPFLSEYMVTFSFFSRVPFPMNSSCYFREVSERSKSNPRGVMMTTGTCKLFAARLASAYRRHDPPGMFPALLKSFIPVILALPPAGLPPGLPLPPPPPPPKPPLPCAGVFVRPVCLYALAFSRLNIVSKKCPIRFTKPQNTSGMMLRRNKLRF